MSSDVLARFRLLKDACSLGDREAVKRYATNEGYAAILARYVAPSEEEALQQAGHAWTESPHILQQEAATCRIALGNHQKSPVLQFLLHDGSWKLHIIEAVR